VELGAGVALRPDRSEHLDAAFSMVTERPDFKARAREFAARYASFDANQSQLEICARISMWLSP
jgi:hypothetical protein